MFLPMHCDRYFLHNRWDTERASQEADDILETKPLTKSYGNSTPKCLHYHTPELGFRLFTEYSKGMLFHK